MQSVLPQSDEATADELARARAALEHRGPARAPLEPARKRAFEFLVRRGYSTTVAYRTVREWSAGSTISAPLCRVILLSATVGETNFMPVLSLTALDRGFFVSSAKCNR